MSATIQSFHTIVAFDDDAWTTSLVKLLLEHGYAVDLSTHRPRVTLGPEGLERKRKILEAQRRAVLPN